jgi:hypothetical protein
MHLVLLGLGIASVVAGAAMLGFGISNNEFGVGNALIGAGTTALVGGVVTIGLAVAVGQLMRIVSALEMQATGRAMRSSVAVAPVDRPSPQDRVEPAVIPVVPSVAGESTRPGPPAEAPRGDLAPVPPVAPPSRTFAKTKGSDPTDTANATPEPSAGRSRGPATSEIPVVLSRRERGFDTVWPAEPGGETASGAPSGDTAAQRAGSSGPTVTILKSGVIEGMAYTLYSDGSIEAELPRGVMRFATIEALRNHLANSA